MQSDRVLDGWLSAVVGFQAEQDDSEDDNMSDSGDEGDPGDEDKRIADSRGGLKHV